jgi:hypothetical protein
VAAAIFVGTALFLVVMLQWPSGVRVFVAALQGVVSLIVFSESFRLINARERFLGALAEAVGDKRSITRLKLQQFYIEGGEILDTAIPKDISPNKFKKYGSRANIWVEDTANWIGENLARLRRQNV